MQEKKEIKQYYNNNELDLERIIEDFTPYISKIINNMVKESQQLMFDFTDETPPKKNVKEEKNDEADFSLSLF